MCSTVTGGAWVIITIGGVLMGLGVHGVWRMRKNAWRAVPGQVLASWAEPVPVGKLGPNYFRPHVVYTWRVDGQAWHGDRFAYVHTDGMDTLARVEQRLRDDYAPGAAINVWHQIARPQCAYLHPFSPHSRSHRWALVVGGALVIALGLVVHAISG